MVAGEQQCCAFLTFSVHEEAQGFHVRVTAPEYAREAADELFCPFHPRESHGSRTMTTALLYVLAALGEIAGCFSFWAWLRLEKSVWWVLPGMTSLAFFAFILTRVDRQLRRSNVRRIR